MEKYSRIKALISLDAIRYNFEQMKKNIKEGTKIIAVIKADAYGHGAVPIARMLEEFDYIWGFAAATAQEALQLRRAGITRPILILGLVFEEYYKELAENDVRMAVCDYETARKFNKAAEEAGKKGLIHLAADTGMTRIGFKDSEESLEEIRRIAALPNVEIEGLFTHFARADEYDRTPAMVQLKRYLDFADLLEKNGIHIPLHHCSNSAGIIRVPEANLNIVRAGITIYGIYPSEEVEKDIVMLKPVMSLKSQFMVDVTEIPDVKTGDEVTLLGKDGDEVISADTLGDLSGRFSYEFVCNISKRVPRIYIRDGKECGELTYFD